MYGGGDFDGSSSAFMGGGFMPSQGTPHPPDSNSSFSKKTQEGRCLLPLTVKQIRDLTTTDESSFFSGSVEVTNVTVVGRVCKKEDKATEYTCVVEDGTGQIECTRWIQEPMDAVELEAIPFGAYVRVHGHLRGMQGRRFITAFSIRAVSDFNEVPSHFIECIYVHKYNSKFRASGLASQSQAMNNNTPVKGYPGSSPNQSSSYYGSDGLSASGQRIMGLLRQPAFIGEENGVHRRVIASQLNMPMDKLMEEVQCLVDNGFIYSTIDEDHYKSTING